MTAKRKIISTPHAPAAVGPYSQAVQIGDLVYSAGQIPLVPETGKMVERIVGRRLRSESIHNGRIPKHLKAKKCHN